MKFEFLMSKEVQSKFFEYLDVLDCRMLIMKNRQIYSTDDPFSIMDSNGLINAYIYNPMFGELDIYSTENGDFSAFSDVNSAVISFSNSPFFEKQAGIKIGKISTKPSFFKDGKIEKKSKYLEEYFKKIRFWIERTLPLKNVYTENSVKQIRVSEEILYLFETGKIKKFL